MLKLNGVSKIYNQNTSYACTALSRVDLEINRGDSIAIMGVSGSGKSTLLNILSTIYGKDY
ncbi:MAG: ATP-binding cassette domain-containing protein [Clostridia bacterium]